MNADSFEGVIRKAYPVPEETYARAKWMEDATEACRTLAKWYARENASLVSTIQTNGLLSDEYALEAVYRPYATVNKTLLKEKEPGIFAACVHVKQAFAEKTLGRRQLYDLVADALGGDVAEYEVVNASEVRAMLPSSLAALYVQEGEEFVKYSIVEKEG